MVSHQKDGTYIEKRRFSKNFVHTSTRRRELMQLNPKHESLCKNPTGNTKVPLSDFRKLNEPTNAFISM